MDARRFIRHVAERLRVDARHAEAITSVVFDELRHRLTPTDSSHVATQLPRGLQRLWAQRAASDTAIEPQYRLEFFGEVMQRGALLHLRAAEDAVIAVFASLQRLLASAPGGEAAAGIGQLPRDLEMLWRKAAVGKQAGPASPRPRARHLGPRHAGVDKRQRQVVEG